MSIMIHATYSISGVTDGWCKESEPSPWQAKYKNWAPIGHFAYILVCSIFCLQ